MVICLPSLPIPASPKALSVYPSTRSQWCSAKPRLTISVLPFLSVPLDVAAVEVYRGSVTRYSFPRVHELREAFAGHFFGIEVPSFRLCVPVALPIIHAIE